MKRKWLAVGIILLFTGVTIAPAIAQNIEKSQSSSRGTWLYVGGSGPGNYTRIQDAIDNASDGDTVFVYDDSSPYFEQLHVNVSISLIGEDKNTTIIDGSNILPPNGTINIKSNGVNIARFTLRNSNWNGVRIVDFSNNTIINNIFINNHDSGVSLFRSDNNIISFNEFSTSTHGIRLNTGSDENIIQNNCFTMAELDGIWTGGTNHNFIINNTIEHNGRDGIRLQGAGNYIIESNFISHNARGLSGQSAYCRIEKNIINNNRRGIQFDSGSHNTIKQNNFFSNNLGLSFSYSSENIVESNNFLLNVLEAKTFLSTTTWSNNFWNRPRLLPKPIINWQIYWIIEPSYFRPGLPLIYPRPFFDFAPALLPNNIT
jgi:nitrous oxidase accessory protein